MTNDERCCGSGTCIIDANGLCWCGQVWQGNSLCSPSPIKAQATPTATEAPNANALDQEIE